jgi:Protein of unknown function (DUF3606)
MALCRLVFLPMGRDPIFDTALSKGRNMKPGSTDKPTQIDIHQPHAVGEWAEELGVTPEELIAAVQKVGPALDDVLAELRKNQPPHPGLF